MSQEVKQTKTLTFTTQKTELINLDVYEITSIEFGADIVGSSITMEQASDPDGTPSPVYLYNNVATPVQFAITHTTLTARTYIFNPRTFQGLKNARFVSNSASDNALTMKVNLKRIG